MRDVRLLARPLVDWPGRLRTDAQRAHAPFKATWTQTVELLKKEAEMLGAREVVLQLAVAERDIRNDGWIRADARTSHPGVTVVLPESLEGLLSFTTDRYQQFWGYGSRMPGWQANVRAIALSMEALRAADRHGVMQGRQYAGFKSLGSGIAMGAGDAPRLTVEGAARFIAQHAGWVDVDEQEVIEELAVAYRDAAKRLHPDAGGDAALFAQLQEAKQVLEQHGGAR